MLKEGLGQAYMTNGKGTEKVRGNNEEIEEK